MSIFRGMNTSFSAPSGLIVVGTPVVNEPSPEEDFSAEQPVYSTPTVNVHHVPRTDERQGLVKFDFKNNVVDAYFSEYAVDVEFLENIYQNLIWPQRVPQSSCENVFTFRIDASRIPTCRFFSPSTDQIADSSTPHPEYPYYNTSELPLCLNAKRALIDTWNTKVYDTCEITDHETCPYAETPSWVEQFVAYRDDGATVKLETSYLGNRVRHSRISVITGDEPAFYELTKISSQEHHDALYEKFVKVAGDTEIVSTGRTLDDIFISTEVPVKFIPSLLSTTTE